MALSTPDDMPVTRFLKAMGHRISGALGLEVHLTKNLEAAWRRQRVDGEG